MRKSTRLLFSVVALLTCCNLWLLAQLKAERARSTELRTQVVAGRVAKSDDATIQRAANLTKPAQVGVERSAVHAQAPDDVSARIEAARKRHERFDASQRRLMADPEYREARLQEQRLQLYGRRDDALRLLGFTSTEADGVIDLLAEMELQSQSLHSPMNEADRLQRVDQEAALKRNLEQGLRKLLGDSKYAQWQDYMGSLPTRATVSQLQSRLAGIESLRDDQIEPLVSALCPVSTQYDHDMAEYLESAGPNVPETVADDLEREEHRVGLVATHNQRMHDAAAPILSHRQLATFDAQLQSALETQQAWLKMSRASMKEASGTVAKTP